MFGSHLLVVAMRYEKGELLPYSSTGNENFPSIFKRNRKVLNKNLKLIKMRSAVLTELPIFQTFSTATALPIRLNGSGQLLQSSDLYLQLHNLLKRRVRNTCGINNVFSF